MNSSSTGKTGFELKPGMTVREAGIAVFWKVIQETALAFYWKNPDDQYDIPTPNTVLEGAGGYHLTSRIAPECITEQVPYYSVCRSFPPDVYWNAFRYRTPGLDVAEMEKDTVKGMAWTALGEQFRKYVGDESRYFTEKEAFIQTLRDGLRPGDFIWARRKGSDSGHMMLFLGDCLGDGKSYLLHSWPYRGGKWDKVTGVEAEEPYGSLRLQTDEELIYQKGPSPNYCLTEEATDRVAILRFTEQEAFLNSRFTDAAVTRFMKPGLDIRKTSSSDVYGTVLPGEEITIREDITNHGNEAFDVTIRESAAGGTEIIESSCRGRVLENVPAGTVAWQLTIPPEASREVSFTVKVTQTEPGDLCFPAGTVDLLPTRAVHTTVGLSRITGGEASRLNAESRVLSQELASDAFEDLGFVNRFYEKVLGVQAELPKTVGELLDALYEVRRPVETSEELMLVRKADPDPALAKLLVPRCAIGKYLFLPDTAMNSERILDLKESYFLPGDVLAETHGKNTTGAECPEDIGIFLYLGDGKVLSHTKAEGTVIARFEDTFAVAGKNHFAVILRPLNGVIRA